MANEEVSNIGVKLSLDASNFASGLGTAQGKLNTFQQQAAKAASGASTSKAGAGQTPTTLKVAVEPAQLQAAIKTAATGLQTVHVPIDVDSRSIAAMRTKITQGLGVIPVQISAQFPKSGPNSPQAIIGTVFSSLGGVSPQKGQTLAKQAIEQILPKRAQGGPVSSGRPVVVGDGGRAEVFRPGASGFIERDVQEYRRRAAELAALEYQIQQRQNRIQHALKGARVPMLPPGTSMPMPLGTAPLREGYVRGYHATKANRWGIGEGDEQGRTAAQNLRQIREHGLRMRNAQGHTYGEPDMNWFSGDVKGYDEAYAVEAHLPEHWFRNTGRSRRWSNPPTIGGPSSNMAVGRDISRRRIASFNEPWMRHTRYMQDETRGTPGRVMRQLGSTINSMRESGRYEAETQGYDQFVAEAWRARHRGMGGYARGGRAKALQPVACPSCKLVNWQTMAGAPRAACMKCGSPLSMKRRYGGEVTSLYGGDPEVMEEAAIKHFGVTDDIREAGYLTPSGKFLDFSGRHQATGYDRQGDRWVPKAQTNSDPLWGHLSGKDYLAGQRSIDHNEATEILPGVPHEDATSRMNAMGFIRVWGTSSTPSASDARNIGLFGGRPLASVGAEMSRLPTTAQITRLVGAAREAEHASIDVMDPMGYRLPNASFRTEWPDDPIGGKKMGSFVRQAIEAIQKNDMKAEEVRDALRLGAGFNPNAHRAGGGEAKAAKAYGEWAVQHSLMMGGSGRIKVAPNEFAMVNRGNAVLDALSDIGQTRAATGMHRAFYDIERGKIESEAGKLGGVSGHQLVDVVAALSSNQPWDRNVAAGIQAIRAVQGQGPAGFANREQLEMVEAILAGKRVTGVKRLPFADAFYDPNAFPIDRWMGRITTLGMKTGIPAPKSAMELMQALRGKDWIGKDVPQPAVRRASIFTINELAKRRGIDPREAQAEPWGTIRDLNKEAVKYFRFDTKTGRAMPRASGGPVMASGPFAKAVFQTGADWASDPYMAMMAWQAQQQKQHRAGGGDALSEIRTLTAYRRYVAQHADEPLFTRWSPDITKDMRPGTVSTHLEGWRMPDGGFEKGISAMPATPEAARRLKRFRARRGGESVPKDDLEHHDQGLAGWYDLGPSRKSYSYRDGPGEGMDTGFRQRSLYLMRGRPVGRGFDSEPVLEAASIEPIAKIRRKAVDQAYREWVKKTGYSSRLNALEKFDAEHRARGGRVARDFAGPPLAEVPARMSPWYKGDQDWLDIMSGEYGWGSGMAGYQRHITDEQWRGPEAGKPRVSLPGMQDEPELSNVLRSMALARHQGRSIKGHAAGGPTGRGLYIINEQGDNSEGFVAGKDAHLIPKFVMDRIPHARDGAQTGMINKPANSFFAPEQDGIIIPKWAVPYVGALRHAQTGFSNVHGVAVDPSDPRIPTINSFAAGPGMTPEALASQFNLQTWAEHTAGLSKAIHAGAAGRDVQVQRPNISRELQEGRAGIGKELPSRTAQGAIASVGSFLFGGVQQLGQAQVRLAHAQQDYNRAQSNATRLVSKSAAVMGSYRDALRDVNLSSEERTSIEQDRSAYLAKQKPILQASIATEKARGEELERADAKARPTQAGIVKNIGVIIGATTLYGMAMQAAGAVISPAVDGTVEALKSLGDQVTGFGTTSTRVTKGLGDQLNQAGGNIEKTFGDVGLQTRMSAGFADFLQQTLGGAAVAKAAAANQGQQSELFRAALGVGNAPSGLSGGFGGVLGTSLLASQLGGGKGLMEQISGDISAFSAGKLGGFAGMSATGGNVDKGLLFAQNQNFRDYVTAQGKQQGNGGLGAITDILGGAGDLLRQAGPLGGLLGVGTGFFFPKTETPTSNSTGGFVNPALLGKTPAEQTGVKEYLKNLGEEAKRGAQALGTSSANTYQLAKDQDQLMKGIQAAAASGDAFAVSMAVNGVILADATGKAATGADDFATAAKNLAKGLTVPDPAVFIKTQAQSLRAGFEMVAAQAAHQLEIGIPGQLGMQLAAQPFMPAAAGVLTEKGEGLKGKIGGIDIGKTLADAQSAQKDLTLQGQDALKALSDWIGQQPGMGATTGPGVQYTAPIGPGINGSPLPSSIIAPGQTGKEAFDTFTGQMMAAGKAITEWQTKIANVQTQQQWAQFSNNLRLSNRAYADALALAGRGGGGRGSRGEMGGLERQQAMLGFMLSQKQINFQTAIAGFQAPGLTSEERAARQAEAQAEARIAQKQLNIQKREFTVGAGRGVEDTGAARKLLISEQKAQTAIAAAQKAIAAEQVKLSQAQAKAQVILQKAEGNWGSALSAAGSYVAQFGGSVQTAVKTIYTSLGFTKTKSGAWVQNNPMPTINQYGGVGNEPYGPKTNASGFLGSYARGAVLQVGEAGPETVAILRNPRAMMMGGGGFGGGGGPITVTLNLTVQGDVSGDATVAKIVRAVEDSFNRKAARLGMRGLVSAMG